MYGINYHASNVNMFKNRIRHRIDKLIASLSTAI